MALLTILEFKVFHFLVVWYFRYRWQQYLPGDITAGITVGIMHIPMGKSSLSVRLEFSKV